MNTTQPGISARIRNLEDDLGAKLFHRTGKQIKLTAEGIALLPYVEKMMALRAEMICCVGKAVTHHGAIRLGVTETIVHTWLHSFIKRLRVNYPGITVELQVDTTLALHKGLENRAIDIAFLAGPPPSNSDMHSEFLCRYPMSWMVSPKLEVPKGHISLQELSERPIITYPPGTPLYEATMSIFRSANVPPIRVNGSNSLSTIIRLAVDGIGFTAIPPAIVKTEVRKGLLRMVYADPQPPDLEFFVVHPTKTFNPITSIVVEIAPQVASEFL